MAVTEASVAIAGILVAFVFVLAIVLAPLFLVLALVKMAMGGPNRRHRSLQQDEARLIQQIHEGLSRMDRRVEALETILLEQQSRGRESAWAGKER